MTREELKQFLSDDDPLDDVLCRERGASQPPNPEAQLDTNQREPDWSGWDRWCDSRIANAILPSGNFCWRSSARLGQMLAEERQGAKNDLDSKLRALKTQMAEAQTTIAELHQVAIR